MSGSRWMFLLPLTLLVSGCASVAVLPGPQSGQDAQPVYGGVFNAVAYRGDTTDWDPNFEGRASFGTLAAYNRLLSVEVGPNVEYTAMTLKPELAERWEVSPDGKTLTFSLRKGVKFANLPPVNGREFTAADVKWTAEYYTRSAEFKDKKLAPSRNAFMYEGLDRAEALDPYTARLSFKEPYAPFLSYAASSWNPMVAREIFDEDGSHKDRMVGTGPYQLDPQASQRGTRWVFKKNPTYWEAGKPYLDEIRNLVIIDDGTAQAAFQTKQLDVHRELKSQGFKEGARAVPSAVAFKYFQPHALNLRLSQAQGQPTTDSRVRRAVNHALDRDEISKVYADGEGVWALPGAMAGLFTEAEAKQLTPKYDLQEARRLLAEAGYASGLTLELPIDDGRSQDEKTVYQLYQAQLKRAGINVDIKVMDRTQQTQKRRAGDFGLDPTTGLSPLEADNDSILFGEFHSKFHGTSNNAKISDPELDRLLEAQRREMQPEKRRELLRNTVKRLVDQTWYVGLIYPPQWDLIHPHVKNYHMHFSNRYSYLWTWQQK